jgi:phosphoribosyl 1,2-cyclic phosphate phosphodiesterase
MDQMQDLDALVLDCLRFKEHPTHLWLDKALVYIEKIKPRRAYLTHIAHDVMHARDSSQLPEGVSWAFDGLVVTDE